MIVLDTNVISEIVRPQPDPGVVEWLDRQSKADVYLTAVSVGELAFGVARLPSGRRREAIAEAVDDTVERLFATRVLPYDASAARHFGLLAAAREAAGRPVSVADGQIAAICLAHGATLATRNTTDFWGSRVPLVDPWAESQ